MWRDFTRALFGLGRQPLVVATVLVTLAVGIGANTTIFTVLDAVVFRELPFPNPEELYSIAGRGFLATDRRDAPAVAIVNDTFARRFLDNQRVVGQRMDRLSTTWTPSDPSFQYAEIFANEVEVVGVVRDMKYASLSLPAEPAVYLPHEQGTFRRMTVVVRSALSQPDSLVPLVRREIASMDPQLTMAFNFYPDVVRSSLARERLSVTLMSAFGLIALLLAGAGVYGVMSYAVTQRTAELAVRAAFGTAPAAIVRLVLARGIALAGIGIVVGIAGAVVLPRTVASQLYEVSATDPQVFMAVPAILLCVAVLASFAPARRAARANPAELLRRG